MSYAASQIGLSQAKCFKISQYTGRFDQILSLADQDHSDKYSVNLNVII